MVPPREREGFIPQRGRRARPTALDQMAGKGHREDPSAFEVFCVTYSLEHLTRIGYANCLGVRQ